MDSLLATDFVYTCADGKVLGKREYVQAYVSNPSVVWTSQNIKNYRVHTFGNTAVLTALVHDNVRIGDRVIDADFQTTQVYVQRGGRWHYVVGHASKLE